MKITVLLLSTAILLQYTEAFVPSSHVVQSLQRQHLNHKQSSSSSTSFILPTSLQAVDDKVEVREYFNNEGFNRWNKIYSESEEVNTVQLDIRKGHDQTIQKILNWIQQDTTSISGKTVCDCGCGVGSLAIPLAQMGKLVQPIVYLFV